MNPRLLNSTPYNLNKRFACYHYLLSIIHFQSFLMLRLREPTPDSSPRKLKFVRKLRRGVYFAFLCCFNHDSNIGIFSNLKTFRKIIYLACCKYETMYYLYFRNQRTENYVQPPDI